jgi:predicted O-linked N-acetylglucosamine transferase (SPINDLY family)
MRSHAQIDVAPDTHSRHGTITTFDALWLGVVVVTLGGRLLWG